MTLHTFSLSGSLALLALTPAAAAQSLIDTFHGAQILDDYGLAVGCAGDVNADGVADWIVGAPRYDGVETATGFARVLSGADGSILFHLTTGESYALFGTSACGVGDVNGDGHDDVLIGAVLASFGGRAYLYSGADGALLRQHDGVTGSEDFGYAVARIADLNGDLVDDYAISGPEFGPGPGGGDPGRVVVYSGADGAVIHTIAGMQNSRFGYGLADVGDVDGDGVHDLAIGAPTYNGGFPSNGAARVVSGATGAVLHQLHGTNPHDNFGWSVAGVGDLDADGHADFAVSAPYRSGGRVYVFSGTDGALMETLGVGNLDGRYGWSLAGPGDLDGDGLGDLLIGAPRQSSSELFAGSVYAVTGGTWNTLHEFEGAIGSGWFGSSLATGEDADGDGVREWIGGATRGDPLLFGRGAAFVYRGGSLQASSYCDGGLNSIGREAQIGSTGVTSVLDNQLALDVRDAVPAQFGLFFYGDGATQVPFGDGSLCVAGATVRLNPPQTVNAQGNLERALDFTAAPMNAGPGEITPGTTRYFQFWYRDPAGPGGSGFNLSDGRSVSFTP